MRATTLAAGGLACAGAAMTIAAFAGGGAPHARRRRPRRRRVTVAPRSSPSRAAAAATRSRLRTPVAGSPRISRSRSAASRATTCSSRSCGRTRAGAPATARCPATSPSGSPPRTSTARRLHRRGVRAGGPVCAAWRPSITTADPGAGAARVRRQRREHLGAVVVRRLGERDALLHVRAEAGLLERRAHAEQHALGAERPRPQDRLAQRLAVRAVRAHDRRSRGRRSSARSDARRRSGRRTRRPRRSRAASASSAPTTDARACRAGRCAAAGTS